MNNTLMNPIVSSSTSNTFFLPEQTNRTLVTDLAQNWPLNITTVNSNRFDMSCCLECKDNNGDLGKKISIDNIKNILDVVKLEALENSNEKKQIHTITTVTRVISRVTKIVKNTIKSLLNLIKTEVDLDKIKDYFSVIKNLQRIAEEPWNFVDKLITAGINGLLGDKIGRTLNKVFGFVDKIKTQIGNAITDAGNFINNLNNKLRDFGLNIVNPVANLLSNLSKFINPVKGFFNFLKTSLSEKLLNLKANILNKAKGLISSLGMFVGNTVGTFVNKASESFSILRTQWSRLLDGGIQYSAGILDSLKSFSLSNLAKGIKNTIGNIKGIFSDIYDKVLNFSSDTVLGFFEGVNFDKVSQLFNNLVNDTSIHSFIDKIESKLEQTLDIISSGASLNCITNALLSKEILDMEKSGDYSKIDSTIEKLNCSNQLEDKVSNSLAAISQATEKQADKLENLSNFLDQRPLFNDCKRDNLEEALSVKSNFFYDPTGVF